MILPMLSELSKIVPHPCFDRPFECYGRLEDCELIIVGENPAVQMDMDWWMFWNADGFNASAFERAYYEKMGGRITLTRKRVLTLIEPLQNQGISCIVTNADRNERPGGSMKVAPNDAVLKFLLRLPRLNVIVAHGKIAQNAISTAPNSVRLLCARHFSRISNAAFDDLRQLLIWQLVAT
jgi:hypothetical protein